jgi:hypothetical protein
MDKDAPKTGLQVHTEHGFRARSKMRSQPRAREMSVFSSDIRQS